MRYNDNTSVLCIILRGIDLHSWAMTDEPFVHVPKRCIVILLLRVWNDADHASTTAAQVFVALSNCFACLSDWRRVQHLVCIRSEHQKRYTQDQRGVARRHRRGSTRFRACTLCRTAFGTCDAAGAGALAFDMAFCHCDQCSIDVAVHTVSVKVSRNAGHTFGGCLDHNLQLGAMHVAAAVIPRRVVCIPVGGDTPLIAIVEAVQLGVSMSVAIVHSSGR